MYYIVYILLLLFSIKEIFTGKIDKYTFYSLYVIITFMATFRFGQGTDYYNYYDIYNNSLSLSNMDLYAIFRLNDPGFILLNYIFAVNDVYYPIFASLFSLFTMIIFYKFFYITCNKSVLSLFLFYTLFYFIYVFNLMRQGFVMACVCSILYPLLLKNKYIKYYILLILFSTIHQSVLIWSIVPLILKIKINKIVFVFIFVFLVLMLLFGVNLPPFIDYERIDNYVSESSDNMIYAKIFRIMIVLPVFVLFIKRINYYLLLLLFGLFVYTIFSYSELVASRLEVFFRLFIIPVILLSLFYFPRYKFPLFFYYLLISSILWFKDINATLEQGGYVECNIFTYPYINVFNPYEIEYYRR